MFKERELKDLEKIKKIEIIFDKLTAMDYINKAYQAVFYNQKYSLTQLYNETIRKQEIEKQKLGQNILEELMTQATTFQIIDDKKECRGYFADGKLRIRDLPDTLKTTWDWSELIGDRDITLAKIIAEGQTINDACPDHLKERLEARERK